MTKKFMVGGMITAALFAGIAGCSRTPAQTTSSNDIFAPSAVPTGPVSEPIVAAIPVAEANTVSYAPQPVPAEVYQPVVVPPMQQAQVAPLLPAPTIVAPGVQEAPLAPPVFDCDNIPTSKSGLTRYRESCL